MKSLIIAAAFAAGLGAAAPVFAQDVAGPTLTKPQPYASLGYTYLSPYGHDLGELQGRLGAKFSPYWGVEGEIGGGIAGNHFSNGPQNTRVGLTERLEDAIYGVGYLPLAHDRFELLARVGYGDSQFVAAPDALPNGLANHHGVTVASWNYGGGAIYNFTPKDAVRFDYTRRDFQDVGLDNPRDIDTYAISYVRKF
jgi:opacity protein-like surface antigen